VARALGLAPRTVRDLLTDRVFGFQFSVFKQRQLKTQN
jgi:hypothetical protein